MNGEEREIAAASVKLPPFWPNDAALWFCQVESQFAIAGIRADETKFNYIVGKIESNVLSQVSDIIINRPQADMYATLKAKILDCFTDSAESQFKKLLNEINLDGRKPSHLLKDMKRLAGDKIHDTLLKSLWLQRLPVQAQTVLAASDVDLNNLGILADRILEASSVTDGTMCGVSRSRNLETDTFFEQLNKLAKQVEDLKMSRSNATTSTDRSFSYGNNRNNRSFLQGKDGMCFYHHQFRERAHKCISPCNFNTQSSSENK